MSTCIIPIGGISVSTKQYVYPKIAVKTDSYVCPECNDNLVLCKGNIRAHYFRHKINTSCAHYSSPSESVIHKDAKLLLKTLLEKKLNITLLRNCCKCLQQEEFSIPDMDETSSIALEYRFDFQGTAKIADVVYLDNNIPICIFEICHTHTTNEQCRPEPWFEINATELLQLVNDAENTLTHIQIPDMRLGGVCEICVNAEAAYRLKRNKAIELLDTWFSSDIPPLTFRDYAGIVGYRNCTCNDEDICICNATWDYSTMDESSGLTADCLVMDKDNTRYLIDFTLNPLKYTDDWLEQCIGLDVYYIDLNWILSQTTPPTTIQCTCIYNSELNTCIVNKQHMAPYEPITPIYTYNDNLIYLRVNYNNRSTVKMFKGRWDNECKLWTVWHTKYWMYSKYIDAFVGVRILVCELCNNAVALPLNVYCKLCNNIPQELVINKQNNITKFSEIIEHKSDNLQLAVQTIPRNNHTTPITQVDTTTINGHSQPRITKYFKKIKTKKIKSK